MTISLAPSSFADSRRESGIPFIKFRTKNRLKALNISPGTIREAKLSTRPSVRQTIYQGTIPALKIMVKKKKKERPFLHCTLLLASVKAAMEVMHTAKTVPTTVINIEIP